MAGAMIGGAHHPLPPPMLDRRAHALIAPALRRIAQGLVARGIGADAVTAIGFALGLAAAGAIAVGAQAMALVLLLTSRLCDGLDGEVARLTRPTHRGAFLDIALDFMFYASIPLAFAVADPAANALAAAVLLAAFIGTGSSFLAFAVLAERQGLQNLAMPNKGFYFLGGLTEATETLLCFILMVLFPGWFVPLAYGFAVLCGFTWLVRLRSGWTQLQAAETAPGQPGRRR